MFQVFRACEQAEWHISNRPVPPWSSLRPCLHERQNQMPPLSDLHVDWSIPIRFGLQGAQSRKSGRIGDNKKCPKVNGAAILSFPRTTPSRLPTAASAWPISSAIRRQCSNRTIPDSVSLIFLDERSSNRVARFFSILATARLTVAFGIPKMRAAEVIPPHSTTFAKIRRYFGSSIGVSVLVCLSRHVPKSTRLTI